MLLNQSSLPLSLGYIFVVMDRSVHRCHASNSYLLRRHWFGEEMHGIWGGWLQTKKQTKEDMERGCANTLPSSNLNLEDAVDRGR